MAVYFIQAGDGGPVKIGFSLNPRRRLCKIQSDHSAVCRIVRLYEGGTVEEAALHERFAEHRMQGEWFAPAVLGEKINLPAAAIPEASGRRGHDWSEESREKMRRSRARLMDDPEFRARLRARNELASAFMRTASLIRDAVSLSERVAQGTISEFSASRERARLRAKLAVVEGALAQFPDLHERAHAKAVGNRIKDSGCNVLLRAIDAWKSSPLRVEAA